MAYESVFERQFELAVDMALSTGVQGTFVEVHVWGGQWLDLHSRSAVVLRRCGPHCSWCLHLPLEGGGVEPCRIHG
jgi:hypothetical protein